MLIQEHRWAKVEVVRPAVGLHFHKGPGPSNDDTGLVRDAAYLVVAPIIITVGILGNLLTFLVLSRPQFRGVTYTYFLVLAASDLLSLVFSVSVLNHLLTEATRSYSTALWYSYFELLFINIPMTVAIFIVVVITIDRFMSVCRPVDFKRFHTIHYAKRAILGSVIVAVLIWCPSCILHEPRHYENCQTSSFKTSDNQTWWVACMKREIYRSPYYIAYSWIRQTVVIFLPTVVLVVLNSLTVREFLRLRQIKAGLKGNQQKEGEHKSGDDYHLVKLLMAVTVSFFITMVPAGVSNAIYSEIYSTKIEFEIFMAISNDLEILSHALNFYLYTMCSKPIRDAIRDILNKLWVRVTGVLKNVRSALHYRLFTRNNEEELPSIMAGSATNIVREWMGSDSSSNHTDKAKTLSRTTTISDTESDKTYTLESSEAHSCFSLETGEVLDSAAKSNLGQTANEGHNAAFQYDEVFVS